MFNWIVETFFFLLCQGTAFKESYESSAETNTDNADLRRLSKSLIHFHIKVKKEILRMLLSFPDCPVSNTAFRKISSSHVNPVFIHHPGILGERKKKNPHNFTCIAFFFFTFSGRMTEKVFRAKEQPVQGWTAVNSGTFILILSTSRTGRPQDSACCPLRF